MNKYDFTLIKQLMVIAIVTLFSTPFSAFAKQDAADTFTVQKDDKAITLSCGGADILSYYHALHPVAEGVDVAYRKSGFIHPLYSPSGKVLTRIQPPDHYHHYGIWNPWTKTHVEGKEVDFWNLKKKQGTVRFAELLSTKSGLDSGSFKVRQEHVQFLPEGKQRVVIDEMLEIRVRAATVENKRVWLVDIVSKLKNRMDTSVVLDQYRYGGGLGFRATEQWNKENCSVLTSEGKTRKNADGTRAKWCDVNGGFIDTDETSGILFMSHPNNREHPEPMRVWPENANGGKGDMFFEFCPIRINGWTLEPKKEYVLQYRMCVYDGKINQKTAEKLWKSYEQYSTKTKQ